MDRSPSTLAPAPRALVTLVEHHGHLTRAAAALGIPQSSMSRRIHALERQLGVALLIPTGRTASLTPAARRLAEKFAQPLAEIELAVNEAIGSVDADAGTVRFGFPLTMGSGWLMDAISAFRFTYPGIAVHLKQAHGAELTADLRAGELDLAVVIPPPAGVPHRAFGTQAIVAVVPDNHRLAAADGVDLTELREDIFIANPPDYHLREITELWCTAAGFRPNILVEVNEFSTARELVSRGLGVALLPRDPHAPDGLREVPLRGGHHRQVALAAASPVLAPVTERLRDFLVAQARRL